MITGMTREVNEEREGRCCGSERGAMLWLGTVKFMNVFGMASGIPSK
jgi:hypothetical protein